MGMCMGVAVQFVVLADACIDEFEIAVDEEQRKYYVAYAAGQPYREEKDDEHAGCDCRGKFALQVHEHMCG